MITIYSFREAMNSPHKEDTDLILAEWVFEDGKYRTYSCLCEDWMIKALGLSLQGGVYLALIDGIYQELMDLTSQGEELTEDLFQTYIKFFINDFYFRKED